MIRATLATLLLSLTVLAFAPSADAAGPVCTALGESDLYDQTWTTACTPPDCLYNTAPAGWTGCVRLVPIALYVRCYEVTGPINYVPDCT
jgi:hypothetical protein